MNTLFERIMLLENEDIVLVKDVLMARLMNETSLAAEERNIRLLKQVMEEYIRGKVPTIKIILLQDFIKMLDLVLAKAAEKPKRGRRKKAVAEVEEIA